MAKGKMINGCCRKTPASNQAPRQALLTLPNSRMGDTIKRAKVKKPFGRDKYGLISEAKLHMKVKQMRQEYDTSH